VVRLRCAPAAAVAEHTDTPANYYKTLTVLGAFCQALGTRLVRSAAAAR
jgi:hypothetical protein